MNNNTLNNNNLEITRGTIVMVDLPLGNGSVQGGTRPAVVISNDKGNKFSPVLIVIPLTSRLDKKYMPTHHTIEPSIVNGLTKTSIALAEQIITIGKAAVRNIVGTLEEIDINFINRKVMTSLALF